MLSSIISINKSETTYDVREGKTRSIVDELRMPC